MPPPAPKKEELSQTKASSSSTTAVAAAAVLDNTLETIPNSDNSDSSSSSSQQQPSHQRQVIAVSVSKGPSAFFNLARKFLVTDEECDLSALEGAIVSAVDAAHLLERSQIATISRIQTSYVTVDPKKKKETVQQQQQQQQQQQHTATEEGTSDSTATRYHHPQQQKQYNTIQHYQQQQQQSHALHTLATAAQIGRENMEQASYNNNSSNTNSSKKSMTGTLRRARMIITVTRTNAYKKWLEENPVPDMSVHYLPLD